jgi:hypothetical protein
MGGQVVGTVKYADVLVVLVREETVLHDERLIDSGQSCEMEINVDQTEVMRSSEQHPSTGYDR